MNFEKYPSIFSICSSFSESATSSRYSVSILLYSNITQFIYHALSNVKMRRRGWDFCSKIAFCIVSNFWRNLKPCPISAFITAWILLSLSSHSFFTIQRYDEEITWWESYTWMRFWTSSQWKWINIVKVHVFSSKYLMLDWLLLNTSDQALLSFIIWNNLGSTL